MKNNSKGFFERIINILKKNVLVSATIIFAIALFVVAILIMKISDVKEKKRIEAEYEQMSEQEKALAKQDFSIYKDAFEDINEEIKTYMGALANNEQTYLKEHTSNLTENELDNIQVKSKYVESFDNITVYYVNSIDEGNYYLYVTYDTKYAGFDTAVPCIRAFFYSHDDTGKYVLYEKEDVPENIEDNFVTSFTSVDVQDLYNTVALAYNEALEKDLTLADYLDEDNFRQMLWEDLSIILSEREEAKRLSKEEEKKEEGPKIEQVRATTSVNVRKSDSETAERIGTVSEGTILTRYEAKANGWSKISYEGKEAYIKSEYLETTGEEAQVPDTQVADNTTTTENENKTNPNAKYVTATDNVNIRAEADIDSERVGFAYPGDRLEFVEKLPNGWTKIKFNGKDAYVKSDYVQ